MPESSKVPEEFRAFELLDTPIIATDREDRIVFWNEAAERLFGPPAASAVGQLAPDVVGGDGASTERDEIRKTIREKGHQRAVVAHTTHEGRRLWVEWAANEFQLPDGGGIGIVAIATDITESKQGEEALRESEAKYRGLFEKMLNGFAYHRLIVDEDGRPADYVFLEINSAFENLTGMKREDLIGGRVTEALPGIENDPTGWIDRYGEVVLEGKQLRFEADSDDEHPVLSTGGVWSA